MILKIFGNKKNNTKDQQNFENYYILLEIDSGGNINMIKAKPEELPKSLLVSGYSLLRIDDQVYRCYVVVKNYLTPTLDIPLIRELIAKNPYIPLNTVNMHYSTVHRFKKQIYEFVEVAQASKWNRIIMEKGLMSKSFQLSDLAKYIFIAIIIAGLIGIAYVLFFKPQSNTPAPLMPLPTNTTNITNITNNLEAGHNTTEQINL